MDDADVVTPSSAGGWKAALLQPKVWIPAVAGVAAIGIVIAFLATRSDAEPASSPSPSATATASASASPSPSPSVTESASPSASPSASAAPSESAEPEPSDEAGAWVPDFPVPGSASEGTTVASFPVSDAFAMGPVLSPDGTHAVAGRWGMDGPAWFVGPIDGSKLVQLKDVDGQSWHEPVWSPSGAQVAYVKNGPGGPVLAVAAKDGSGAKNVAPLPMQHADAGADSALLSWSGDGKYIAVTQTEPSGELADSIVTIFEVANGNSTQISKAGSAAFSPKGATLAYVTLDSKGKPALVTRTAGGKVTTLRTIGGLTWARWASPTLWSPDASRIAYLADWTHDLWPGWHSIRADGGGEVKLTDTYESPVGSWAPDSRHFAAGGYGRDGVVVGGDGSKPIRLEFAAPGISWAGPTVVVATASGRIDAFNLESGQYADTGFHSGNSSGYVVGAGNVGVLVIVDMDSGKGTVSVHKP